MSKSKSKQEEALQLLDDLDSFTPPEASGPMPTTTGAPTGEGEAEVLAFIDEITQKSSEPTRTSSHLERPISRSSTPTGSLRKSTERVRLGGGSVTSVFASGSTGKAAPAESKPRPPAAPVPQPAQGGWGWGSVWNSASTAIQQAKSVVDEQVKNLPSNEQALKWREGVMEYAKNAQLDKLSKDFKRVGLSTLTDILNVVAPPISEHEVIQVWLSHDMRGYDGIESLVYRALARIMEQVEGGDLIVNRGEESRPKDNAAVEGRDLNSVEGFDAAVKLAQANLDQLIKTKNALKPETQTSSTQSPTSYSYVYLRVQPFLTSHNIPMASPMSPNEATPSEPIADQHLQFLLYLSDPSHNLVHTTLTQAVPGKWLDIWDQYDWVEDLVAEALRVGVEVVGQEYVVARMGWGGSSDGEAKKESEAAVPEKKEETVPEDSS
ncbi:maintenance of telomere capping protein 1 [Mycena floridula]|nr:maintenance of telomere capping protein 1 [Mycena floridula]